MVFIQEIPSKRNNASHSSMQKIIVLYVVKKKLTYPWRGMIQHFLPGLVKPQAAPLLVAFLRQGDLSKRPIRQLKIGFPDNDLYNLFTISLAASWALLAFSNRAAALWASACAFLARIRAS